MKPSDRSAAESNINREGASGAQHNNGCRGGRTQGRGHDQHHQAHQHAQAPQEVMENRSDERRQAARLSTSSTSDSVRHGHHSHVQQSEQHHQTHYHHQTLVTQSAAVAHPQSDEIHPHQQQHQHHHHHHQQQQQQQQQHHPHQQQQHQVFNQQMENALAAKQLQPQPCAPLPIFASRKRQASGNFLDRAARGFGGLCAGGMKEGANMFKKARICGRLSSRGNGPFGGMLDHFQSFDEAPCLLEDDGDYDDEVGHKFVVDDDDVSICPQAIDLGRPDDGEEDDADGNFNEGRRHLVASGDTSSSLQHHHHHHHHHAVSSGGGLRKIVRDGGLVANNAIRLNNKGLISGGSLSTASNFHKSSGHVEGMSETSSSAKSFAMMFPQTTVESSRSSAVPTSCLIRTTHAAGLDMDGMMEFGVSGMMGGGSSTDGREVGLRKRRRGVAGLDVQVVLRCLGCGTVVREPHMYGDYVQCGSCGLSDFVALRRWKPTPTDPDNDDD